MDRSSTSKGFGIIGVIVIIVVLALASGIGVYVYRQHRHTNTNNQHNTSGSTNNQTNANSNTQTQDVYAGWKTYTSATEKATFRYPGDWMLMQSKLASVYSSDDATGVMSPSGAITITWASSVGGLGNEHSASYPYNTVVNRTPITNASGLYVVSGVTTLDGTTYHPWIALQDANGISQSGVAGDVVTFAAKHAINSSTNGPANEVFSTSGIRADQNTPALTQAQATAWFSSAEAQQAKLVLLSFSDPN